MFNANMTIAEFDPELAKAIAGERQRQEDHVELIASENYTSPRVLEAQGSVLTNKYAEGYPGKRYYGGCEYVDIAESLAIERAKQLFGADFANVQPHSGSQANAAVYLALLNPGDHDSRHEPGSRRPPDARRQGEFLRQAVQGRAVRHQARHRRDRLRPGRAAGAGTPPEDDRRRLLGLFARHRLGEVSRDRRFGGRLFRGRHGARRGPRGRRPLSESRAVRRCGDHHHAQDPARAARRLDSRARQPGDSQEAQFDGVPGHPGRTADARDRGQGGGVPGGAAARVQSLFRAGHRQCARHDAGLCRSAATRSSRAAPTITCSCWISSTRTSPAKTPMPRSAAPT